MTPTIHGFSRPFQSAATVSLAPVENLPGAIPPEAETHPQDELRSQNTLEEKPKHSRRPWLIVGGLAVALVIAGIVRHFIGTRPTEGFSRMPIQSIAVPAAG